MSERRGYYIVEAWDEDERYSLEIGYHEELTREVEARWFAEKAAEDAFDSHDGWESSWPMTFAICAVEDGPVLFRFSVDMEAVPNFSAGQMLKKKE